jgi:hypothetical protein
MSAIPVPTTVSGFRKRTEIAQSVVSLRRQFDFVSHPMFHRIDPSMLGRTRLLTRYEGGVVTVRSDAGIATGSRTRFDVGSVEIEIPGHVDLTGHLLLIGNTEHVVVANVLLKRDFRTFERYTVLELETGLRSSYSSGTTITLAGFPLAPASWYRTGETTLQFDSVTFVLSGDEIAVYSAPDNIPVLGNWCVIASVLSASGAPGAERFSVSLDTPLQQDLSTITRLFLRAVPGYISPILPIPEDMQRRGSVLVDMMSGKVFGSGTDAVALSVTTYDANKETVSSEQVSKNSVLGIGTLACSDLVLWKHRTGRTVIESTQALGATAVLDHDGRYQVGVVTPCAVTFTISLSSSADFKVIVYTPDGPTFSTSLAGRAVVGCRTSGAGYISIAISGSSNQAIEMTQVRQSTVQYLSYGYRVGVDVSHAFETWEGSGMLLKPVFSALVDLEGTAHTSAEALVPEPGSGSASVNLNSGVLL